MKEEGIPNDDDDDDDHKVKSKGEKLHERKKRANEVKKNQKRFHIIGLFGRLTETTTK